MTYPSEEPYEITNDRWAPWLRKNNVVKIKDDLVLLKNGNRFIVGGRFLAKQISSHSSIIYYLSGIYHKLVSMLDTGDIS